MTMVDETDVTNAADRVVLSHPRGVSDRLDSPSYVTYLRKHRGGSVAVGDEWDEIVNRGCGTIRRIRLRVETVEGGDSIGNTTVFSFQSRE